MWDQEITEVVEGEIFTYDGRPVHPVAMVARRWGWPRKSARAAVVALREMFGEKPIRISTRRREMLEQQRRVFAFSPGVMDDILWGLSTGRARRNIDDMSPELGSLEVVLSEPVPDDGLSQGVLEVLACRFACTVDEMRAATTFKTGVQAHFYVDIGRFI